MTLPGVVVQVQTSPPPRSQPTDTGVGFMVGLTAQGPLGPVLVNSLSQFTTVFGGFVTYSVLWDEVDFFFREGGHDLFISRVVGPAAVYSTFTFNGADTNPSLVVKANAPGDWGNSLKVAILAGAVSGFRVQTLDASNVVLETSPDLASQADAASWSTQFSQYLTITPGSGSQVPATHAAQALVTGTDDRASITDAQWLAALNLFTTDLGPGQVAAPGRTSAVGKAQVADHAAAHARVAVPDLADTAVVGDLQTAATEAASTGNGQVAAVFTPWPRIPGRTAGTTRVLPPSGGIMGVIARNDAAKNAGTAAAGEDGQFQSVIGLSQASFSDPNRETLNNAGINVIRSMLGGFRIYGFRSLANTVNLPSWVQFTVARYLMSLEARCLAVGEHYAFKPIDGAEHLQSDYAAELGALCQSDYNAGILYGQSATDAYNVDTGSGVNTPTTIAAGQLRAAVAVRPSPYAELITILIVNTSITGSVS